MKRPILSPEAIADLDAIDRWIASESVERADRVLAMLRDVIELLGRWPRLGRERPELQSGYRTYPVSRWVVFYRLAADGRVEVLHILDASRDVQAALADEEPEP